MPSAKALGGKLLDAIYALPPVQARLMEVCGTHTMAIARAGIKSLLPEGVRLMSGPGCPVCVTPTGLIDSVLELSGERDVIIATYGDMVRVPGSRPGDSLQRRRALGAELAIVYSPMDAVELAAERPDKQVVFLGVGFETTAPGTAAAALAAKDRSLKNFTVWSMLKRVEPAVRALTDSEDFSVNGFLCPGHVASIIGERGFEFLPRDYGLPAVIGGFEGEDILLSIYMLLRQLAAGEARIENQYSRAVRREGNPLAQEMIRRCFVHREDRWRGLGLIEGSGLGFREELAEYDAERRFGIGQAEEKTSPCRCGDVLCGRIAPEQCPMYAKHCTPENPVGPCMVSSEGACAAAYKYGGFEKEGLKWTR